MDANEITCPQCGHLNNYISEGCVKCGIIFSKYLEIQEKEKELEGANTQAQENPPELNTQPGNLKPVTAESTIEIKAAVPHAEPQAQPSAEMQSVEESPPQFVPEVSLDEIEIPMEALSETPESRLPIPPEIQQSDIEELPIEQTADKSAQTESPEGTVVAESQVQTPAQASDPQTDAPVTQEASGEPIKPETEAKPEKESKAEEIKPQTVSEAVAPKEAELAANDNVSASVEEKDKVESSEKEDTAEGEEEILLEEVAEPAETESKSEKPDDSVRAELLRKQKAALATAETLKLEKAAQAKVAALKKKKLVRAKMEALKKHKAAQAKAEALKKQKIELAKAEVLKKKKAQAKAQALKQQKAAQAETEILSEETQAMVTETAEIRQPIMAKSVASNVKIMGLLKKYEGKTIGINYDNSAEIKEAELVEANDEFFSVTVKDKKLQYSYPLKTLLSLIEGEDGVEAEASESNAKYSAVIKVYPLVLF